jgi:FixJ family two-component response regulator
MECKMATSPCVYIIEDDPALTTIIRTMVESITLQTVCYNSASDFWEQISSGKILTPILGCIILDVRLPGMNGMDLQKQLSAIDSRCPVIFITGHGDIPMAVQAMELGAFGFLEKPFREQKLLEKVSSAISTSESHHKERSRYLEFEKMLNTLTKREHTIFELAVDGMMNKVIAVRLNISERTVEVHRSNMLKKLGSKPLPEIMKAYSDYKKAIG